MLTLTSKYAIRALLTLAKCEPAEQFVLVKTLSEKSLVPAPYLAKIIKTLAAKDLLETKKGATGGVRLKQKSTAISFFDICSALHDPAATDACLLSKKACSHTSPCPMHERWGPLRTQLINFLHEMKIDSGGRDAVLAQEVLK